MILISVRLSLSDLSDSIDWVNIILFKQQNELIKSDLEILFKATSLLILCVNRHLGFLKRRPTLGICCTTTCL